MAVNDRPATWVRVVSWVLAILMPLAVIYGAFAGMEQYRSFDDRRESRNAGKVINGHVVKGSVKGGVAGVIESKLSQTEPAIVVLGNSLANTNLNLPLLAKRLGLPKSKIQRFSIPNSMAAHWYAITKNRIYANDHQPKLIIVLSDLQSLLALAPRSEASYLNLSVQLSEDEPFLDEKLGARNYFFERVRENRGKVRDGAMVGVRNLLVDLLLYRSFVDGNEKATAAALERVFDASKTDMRLHNNVIPIYNSRNDHDLVIFDPESLSAPGESFMAEIARMAQENNGRLVFLRPPMSPLLPDGIGDIVLPEHEAEVQPTLDRYGAIYLDLRDMDMDASHFENADHMNGEGSRRFTEIVSELFEDLDVGAERTRGAELLRSVALVDGHYEHLPLDVVFKDAPPDVPRVEWYKGRGKLLYFDTPAYTFLNDALTMGVSPHAARCSPLRVLEDGAPLPHPNEDCDDVLKRGEGRTCHSAGRVYFTTSDGANPFEAGRHFRLAFDPRRSCDAGLWLYPNDRARLTLRPYDVSQLRRGATELSVLAADLGGEGAEGEVSVRVRAAGAMRAEVTVPVRQLVTTGATLQLDPPVQAGAQNMQIELYNPTSHFLLLTSLVVDARRGSGAAPVER